MTLGVIVSVKTLKNTSLLNPVPTFSPLESALRTAAPTYGLVRGEEIVRILADAEIAAEKSQANALGVIGSLREKFQEEFGISFPAGAYIV